MTTAAGVAMAILHGCPPAGLWTAAVMVLFGVLGLLLDRESR